MLASIGGGRLTDNDSLLFETAQHAAEVAGVKAEVLAEFAGGGLIALCKFVEDAHFRQRVRTLVNAILQNADLAGVETVEAADGVDVVAGTRTGGSSHGKLLPPMLLQDS